ncbi:MAG: hypothetical protein H7A23_22565 [Leptospiraceae bacterium]|nr:hypothetical protein [Leptospiraceae bacterium]MCP5497347.1 hypothetical protein [Leptospiraceae bacterium]
MDIWEIRSTIVNGDIEPFYGNYGTILQVVVSIKRISLNKKFKLDFKPMNKKLLLRIAAGLILFTCVGHTFGTFMPIPSEETEMINAADIMKTTLVPMPIGKKQSYFDILLGANICLSIYLLITGLSFILFSSEDNTNRKLLLLHSTGLIGVAIVSGLYFFPLPALCTGFAGVLGFIIYSR